MPYCPQCRAEFRQGFTRCAECEEYLVDHLDQVKPKMDDSSMMTYLRDRELIIMATSTLDKLKPLKNLLCSHSIANIILNPGETCSTGSCLGGGCAPQLELAIAADDAEKAAEVMRLEFREMVNTEGAPEIGEGIDGMLDLTAENMKCPACDADIPSGNNECPVCNLYVGVPEGF